MSNLRQIKNDKYRRKLYNMTHISYEWDNTRNCFILTHGEPRKILLKTVHKIFHDFSLAIQELYELPIEESPEVFTIVRKIDGVTIKFGEFLWEAWALRDKEELVCKTTI